MEIPTFPEFSVPGVPPFKVFMLYGASNFDYYASQVADAISGHCPFCTIDPTKNRPISELCENPSWRVWPNFVAPRADQDYQFVIPCRRHIFRFSELTRKEAGDLVELIQGLDRLFGLEFRGTDFASRCAFNAEKAPSDALHFALGTAQSIEHYHVNYHVPTGREEVKVTFAKSQTDLLKKREVLKVWEKMRQAKLGGSPDPLSVLSSIERALVEKNIKPPQLASKV